jgi:hypothetical protein
MTRKKWCLLVGLLVLVGLAFGHAGFANEPIRLTGTLMEINRTEGYVVINERIIFLDMLSDPAILEGLRERQQVVVDVVDDEGRLTATYLEPLEEPDPGQSPRN